MIDEKRFLKPEADVVVFTNEDIITSSGPEDVDGTGIDDVA